MNTVVCGSGRTISIEGAARVFVAGHDAGSALDVRVLGADGEVELETAVRVAAGGRVYLPDRPFALRAGGRADLRVERIPAWPLRRPLRATSLAVVGRAGGEDPRRAIGRAVRDVAGYLQAVHLWPRAEALARLGLLGDARLLGAGEGGTEVVAEVRLGVAAFARPVGGRPAPAPV